MGVTCIHMHMVNDSLDDYLALIADYRRRAVIERLRDEVDGETTFDALLDHLARRHQQQREEFAAQLHHNHLPKLEAHDVVEYDSQQETVRYRPNESVEAVLDALPEERVPAN